jgi:hypothetical protein
LFAKLMSGCSEIWWLVVTRYKKTTEGAVLAEFISYGIDAIIVEELVGAKVPKTDTPN